MSDEHLQYLHLLHLRIWYGSTCIRLGHKRRKRILLPLTVEQI